MDRQAHLIPCVDCLDSGRSELLGIPRQLQLVQYITAAAVIFFTFYPRQVGGATTASTTGNEEHTVARVPISALGWSGDAAAAFTSMPEEQVGASTDSLVSRWRQWDAQAQAHAENRYLWWSCAARFADTFQVRTYGTFFTYGSKAISRDFALGWWNLCLHCRRTTTTACCCRTCEVLSRFVQLGTST